MSINLHDYKKSYTRKQVRAKANELAVGTPTTLAGAIRNGMQIDPDPEVKNWAPMREDIEAHVRDFLAQKFTAAMMQDMTLTELWAQIIKKE